MTQRALTAILTEVYEEEFHDFSYGFRPGRGCHEALRALARHIGHGRVNWVVEADIKGFFDNVDHEWLLKMVAVRVIDERVLRLIRRMLEAGVMEEGQRPGSDGMKMVAGSRMREKRMAGSERGQGVNRGGEALVTNGCGGSLTNTREAGGGSPAGLAKNSGPTR